MKIYGIYDLRNKEQCLRVGTLQEIIRFLGLSARSVGRALKGTRVSNRYDLVYLFEEGE